MRGKTKSIKRMKLGILTTFFIIKCINSQHLPGNAQCKDLNPQNEVDIDEVSSTNERFNLH